MNWLDKMSEERFEPPKFVSFQARLRHFKDVHALKWDEVAVAMFGKDYVDSQRTQLKRWYMGLSEPKKRTAELRRSIKDWLSTVPVPPLSESRVNNEVLWLFDAGPDQSWARGLTIRVMNGWGEFLDISQGRWKAMPISIHHPQNHTLEEVPFYEGRD